jgi:hypothetical protein
VDMLCVVWTTVGSAHCGRSAGAAHEQAGSAGASAGRQVSQLITYDL